MAALAAKGRIDDRQSRDAAALTTRAMVEGRMSGMSTGASRNPSASGGSEATPAFTLENIPFA